MAIQHPSIGYLRGYDANPDIAGNFQRGFDVARNIKDEMDAPTLIRAYEEEMARKRGGGASVLPGLGGPTRTEIRPTGSTLQDLMFKGSFDAAEDARDPVLARTLEARYPGSQNDNRTAVAALDDVARGGRPASDPASYIASLTGGANDPMSSYIASAEQSESGGKPNARNPRSTATGPFQFLESTWNGLMQSNPELGLTPEGRTDPEQAGRAMRAFTSQNASALKTAGIPISPGTLYSAHFLGAGAAPTVLSAPDEAPMTSLVSAEVIQANPTLADMTAGEFRQWAERKGGNPNRGYVPPGSDGTMPTPSRLMPRPSSEMMAQLWSNRATRPLAESLLAQGKDGGPVESYQTYVGEDGVQYQTNLATGETKVLREGGKAPQVETRFNPETGLEEKMIWNAGTGTFEPFGGPKAPSNGTTMTTNADGTVTVTQGGSGKLTEGQSKDLGFYARGLEANTQLADMDTQLTDLVQSKADLIPLGLGNYLRTPEFRQAKVAADQFLTVILRKDTGAAVTDKEFNLYGPMFLPIPGDDPGTIDQKRRLREVAVLSIESGLGTAEAIGEANRIVLGVQSATPMLDAAKGGGAPAAPGAGKGGATLPDPFGAR